MVRLSIASPVPMLADRYARNALQRLYLNSIRSGARAGTGTDQAKQEQAAAALARQRVLDDLAGYLLQLEARATALGVQVHWADDFQEANRFVFEILQTTGATTVLRNHALLLDEIEADRAAKANKIDLQSVHPGDLYVELVGGRQAHPIYPAAHLRREDISAATHSQWRVPVTYDPDLLARTALLRLRPALLEAKAAVLGLNFAVAATGSLVCLDNDGHNASLVALADHVICLLGIEQVVADVADLHLLIGAYARSAWGRSLPAYITQLAGSNGEGGGPRRIDLILVDNGRSLLLASAFSTTLRCIDCGACHNICPVYRQVGGGGYGGAARTGPIGAVTNPSLMRPCAGKQPFLSSGCNACAPACPVGINLPDLLHDQRVRLAANASLTERAAFWLWERLLTRPQLFFPALRLARRLRPH